MKTIIIVVGVVAVAYLVVAKGFLDAFATAAGNAAGNLNNPPQKNVAGGIDLGGQTAASKVPSLVSIS